MVPVGDVFWGIGCLSDPDLEADGDRAGGSSSLLFQKHTQQQGI